MALCASTASRAVSLSLFLALTTATAHAQDPASTRINEYVRAEMTRRQIPGLALQVLRNHRLVLAANYGVEDQALQTPVTERTAFEVASLTKQFTAAAVLRLAERGMLAVTDPLSKYLPDLPPAWQPITIQQLMSHTSGLRDDWDESDDFFTARTSAGDYLEALKASPLKFAPGSDWSYSCGPFVLGLLIERLTGVTYAEYMRTSFFEPLGMASSAVNDSAEHAPGRASGYVARDGALQPGRRLPLAARARADVGIRTTAHDLALWLSALDDPSLLTEASRRLMFTPARLNNGDVVAHGFGWFITPFRGHTEIAHGGAFRTGFSAYVARYPDDSLTIILLTNQFRARPSEMVRAIASFYNADYRPIATMHSRPGRRGARTVVATRVLNALRDGKRTTELLPDVGRLGGWSRAELREELAQATAPVLIDCQDLARGQATAFGTALVANCFFRTAGDRPRYWTMSFTASGRVAYVELEQ
ncbi:MAG: serine hydrolase domain-containing protein [Gemmatimonadaceae bacterium]